MNRWSVLFAVGAIFLATAPGAMGASVESRERAAKKACLLGEVERGAEILADLYVDTNEVTYIYNQGRCFEQNGKNEQAVLRFKEYLRKAGRLNKADRDAVLKKIEELQKSTNQPEAPAPSPAESPPGAVTTPSVPVTAAPPGAPETQAVPLGLSQSQIPPEPQASPPIYKRWWFWTGVGAVVAGGVVTAILLSSKSAPQSPDCDGQGTCVQ